MPPDGGDQVPGRCPGNGFLGQRSFHQYKKNARPTKNILMTLGEKKMPKEFWAVFESASGTIGTPEGRDIYGMDCIGTCPDEASAIEMEMKNPDYRVHKLIRNTMAG